MIHAEELLFESVMHSLWLRLIYRQFFVKFFNWDNCVWIHISFLSPLKLFSIFFFFVVENLGCQTYSWNCVVNLLPEPPDLGRFLLPTWDLRPRELLRPSLSAPSTSTTTGVAASAEGRLRNVVAPLDVEDALSGGAGATWAFLIRPPPGDRTLLACGGATSTGAGDVAAATLAGVNRTRISPRISSNLDILWLIRWTSLRTSCLSSVNESMMDEDSDRGICCWLLLLPATADGL